MGNVITKSYYEVPVYETKSGSMKDANDNWIGSEWEEKVGTTYRSYDVNNYYCDRCGSFSVELRKSPPVPQEPTTWNRIMLIVRLFETVLACAAGIGGYLFLTELPIKIRNFILILGALTFLVSLLRVRNRLRPFQRATMERKEYAQQISVERRKPFCRCKNCGAIYQRENDLSHKNTWNYTERDVPSSAALT